MENIASALDEADEWCVVLAGASGGGSAQQAHASCLPAPAEGAARSRHIQRSWHVVPHARYLNATSNELLVLLRESEDPNTLGIRVPQIDQLLTIGGDARNIRSEDSRCSGEGRRDKAAQAKLAVVRRQERFIVCHGMPLTLTPPLPFTFPFSNARSPALQTSPLA